MMNSVVINTCYGGFGLSEIARDRYEELTGKEWETWLACRHEPALVQVVRELGEEAASGEYSDLDIREITGTQYWIEEHDGHEILHTPENMRWITIEGGA
tara:strand:- start:2352 stop:2651 length:300 start_codon:yes stop_codon:yes gene_type:complete